MSDIDKFLDEPVSDTPATTGAVDSFMKDAPDTAKGFGGALRDTAVAAGSGAVTGVQLLANAAGADNAVAQKLGDAADYVRGFETVARREERAARAAKIKAAEESGSTWEEIKANVGAFAEAPIDTTVEALGTSLPTIAAAALTRGKVRAPVAGALGGAQGAGAVKGSIYDTVEQEHLAAGATPEEAQARAAEAQSYGGDNAAQIALGAGLGVVAGTTGIEGAVGRVLGREAGEQAAQGVVRSTLTGAVKEAPIEAMQGGQERLASNLALQNEGFDTPTWQGVAGQAALEGVAGAAAGGGFGAVEGALARDPQSAPAVDPTEPASEDPANEPAPTAGPTVEPQAPTAEPQAAGMAPPQVPQQYRTERPYPAKPSEQMGLDPAAGALSDAAAMAVDSGASAQLAQQAAEQQAAEQAQKDAKKGAKAGEQIDTSTGEITQAAGDLLAGDSAAELQDRLNFVKQAARANGWDARLVAERDRLQAELDALAPAPDAGYMDRVSKRAKRIDAAQSSEEVAAVLAEDQADPQRDEGASGRLSLAASARNFALEQVPPSNLQEGIAQAQARRAQEKPADQAAVSPETVTAPAAAEASTQPADQMAVNDESRAVEPSATVEPVADQTTGDIKAIAAKQIPQMTDAELAQAIDHYGPDHKRTAKLQKEQAKRVTQGAGNVPQAAETVEASPQPAQVAGQAPATDAQAAGAATAGSPASVDPAARWEAMSRDERQALAMKSGVKPVFAKSLPGAPWDRIGEATKQKLVEAMTTEAPQPAAQSSIEGRDLGEGWAEFHQDSGTVGIPRAEMPQIKAEHRGAMVNFLNARGVQHEEATVPASALKPTQAEFSRDKVARARDFEGGNRSILISQDGHVLDGHHQWLAARENGEDVKVISLGAPIRELVKLAREFPSSTTDAGSETAPEQPESAEAVDAAAAKSPEFTTLKSTRGDTLTVRTADLNGSRTILPEYTKDGRRKEGFGIHRENLDPTGEKRAARAKEDAANPLLDLITTKDGNAFASKIAAGREMNKRGYSATHEVVPASEVQAGATGYVVRSKAQTTPKGESATEHAEGVRDMAGQPVDAQVFVSAPDGSLDFGEITPEMAKAAGRQAGKIRLQQGDEAFGLTHIELRHGAEIRSAGFADVPAFVADIARHIDEVWKPAATRQLVALHSAGKDRVMFVELQPGKDESGDFYTVKTAFPARPGYTNKADWKLLWEARAQASGDSGNRPSFAEPPQDAGGEATIPSSQSNDSIARPQPEAEAGDKAAIPISIANIKAGDRFQSVKYGNTAPTGGVIEKVGPANITFGGQYMGNPISGVKLPRAALVGGKIVRDGVVYDVVSSGASGDAVVEGKKSRGVPAKKAEAAEKARAEYFAPGNVVKSYGGHDRVVSYTPANIDGQWSVTVRAVEKRGDSWVDKPGERERSHSTQPDARELKAGPVGQVEQVELSATAQPEGADQAVAIEDFPLKEAAASYSGISHSGNDRAKSDKAEFEAYIDGAKSSAMAVAHTQAQHDAVDQAIKDLRADYLAQYRRLMNVRAGTVSSYVAGGSKFNSKQAGKRNSAYDRAIESFTAWQAANTHKARKAALDARTDAEKVADQASAAEAAADKAQKAHDSDLALMRKILSWKKGGEPVAIGKSAVLDGVNKGRDGYPTSIKLKPTDGSTLTDDKFDLAALFRDRKRGESVPDSKRRVRELVDAVRAEDATASAQEDAQAAEPAKPSDSKTPLLDAHVAAMDQARDGKIAPEAFRAAFAQVEANGEAMRAEMNSMSKDKLLRAGGVYFYHRHKDDRKAEVVEALYRATLDEYSLGKSYGPNSYMLSGNGLANHRATKAQALRDLVANTDEAALQQFAAEIAESRKEREARKEATRQALENPKTLPEFRSFISYHSEKHNETRREAYLRLTPEQRRRYDELEAEGTKEARDQAKAKRRTLVASAGNTAAGEVIATKHTKHGHDLYVVKLEERVSREDYDTLNSSAKRMGGSYSSYRGNGAIPGFQFRTREAAEAFRKLVAGDTEAAQEVAQARRDAFEDDRSQSAVERLRTMAAALNERAEEELGRDRKVNTTRRARMASAAEAAANANKALAGTMENIADAIEAGKAKFLDLVRQKVQVEFLGTELRNAKDAQIRAKYPSYADQVKHQGQPIDDETVDYSDYPTYGGMRSDLAGIARQMIEVDGLKNLGQRLLKVADDVSDAYVEWAKNNLLSVSRFARGEQFAEFTSRDDAERAIRRSNLSDRAIVLPLKRGVNRIVLSPSEAMKQGIWQGDDKRIALSGDFGREIVEAVGRRAGSKIKLPWQLETVHAKRKRLEGMGIYTGSEYRAALREFADLQQAMATPDKIKQMERAMIGRRSDGLDFFPTSEAVVDAMLEAAEIAEGMGVLEPSAGMGHIADAIREKTGVEPEVVELSGERRELLQAKGYHLAGDDFMAMQPRTFYTYGDIFQAPDGTKGIMRGGRAWSGRASLHAINEDGSEGKMLGWYDRDDLTGIEQRGSWSGYDRIVMNPPFSKGRDIQHVQHAYSLLKPGGRLVAIMGEGAFFQSNSAAEGFRAWLDDLGATSERLPENSFMDAALPVNTAVNARMVVIDKPATDTSGITADSARRAAVRARVAANNYSREDENFLQGMLKALYEKTGDSVLEHKLSTWLDSRYQRLEAVDQLYAEHDKAFAGKDKVLFSRRPVDVPRGATPVLSHDAVKAIVERIGAGLKLGVPSRSYRSEAELYAAYPEIAEEAERDGAKGQVNAVYYKGQVHVVTSAFVFEADVEGAVLEAMAHEGQGHYGIRALHGNDGHAVIAALREFFAAIGGVAGVKRLAGKHGIDMSLYLETASQMTESRRAIYLADELLAHLQGREAVASLSERARSAVRALYAAVREMLSRIGAKRLAKGSDADISLLLARMRRASKRTATASKGAPRFSLRPPQTASAAFKRWFGDSKVVGADGEPLHLYHGTGADFTVFDQSRAGSATGHATSALGIFMSSDRRAAQNYAEKTSDGMPGYGRVMDLYASIQNPYLMSVEESQEVESPLEARRLRTRLEQQGYDGIRLKGTPVWIAFNNYQVKSATDNSGAFDEFDPDIRFSRSAVRDMASNAANAIASVSVQDVKRSALGKWTDFLSLGLQSLGRRQLVDLYDGMLPMRKYAKLVERMDADKNDTGAAADELARRWGKLKDSGKLADLMHEATLAQTDADPLVPESKAVNPGRRDALNKQFEQLSPEAQAIYREARDAYKEHHRNVIEAIKERVKRSEMGSERKAELLRKMDSEFYKAIQGVYFPLARFGSYVVAVNGPDGKIASVHRAETMGEANALREQLQQKFPRDSGYDVGKVTLDKEFVASRDSVSRGFMSELYGALDGMKLPSSQLAELEDTLGQLYLASMPDLSWAKHGIHRKGTPGFSDDARRAFAQNLFHGARYLAKLRYGDRMQDELDRMQKYADARKQDADYDQPKAQRVIDEMVKRHESMMNPKSNPLSTALTSFGFIYYLGLSPAAAVVNLTQTALVAYPVMGAKWGFNKSAAALMKASNEAVRGKNDITKSLSPEELKAFEKAVRDGTIDVTQAHDLAGIAQGEDSKVMWKIRPVMRMASYMFHQAEVFNRQVTFVASYRLAREAGASTNAAYEQAKKATYDGHFDYSASNRPRLMQGNVAKVVLLFKQYAQNMLYTLTRNTYQAFAGESPAVRKEARKTIGAILALHAAAAGVLGLPLVGPLLAMASAVGGDDDEPWDAEVALRNLLADALGPKASEVIARGLSRLGPADISGRVALNNLLLPDMQEGLEGKKLAEAWTSAMLGPVAGIFTNAAVGANHIAEGRYAMGLESMLPVALRNPLKSLRYADEGVVDRSGVVVRDEVGIAGIASQLVGFSPSEVRLSFEGKSAIFDADRRMSNQRSELMTQFARAAMEGDQEGMAEAREAIAAFNQKNPSRRIQANHLMQSVQARRRRIAQAEDGVYLPRNRADAREAGRFANPE